MLGIMNGVIRTATRTDRNESPEQREARLLRERRKTRGSAQDELSQQRHLDRGYW